MIRFAAMVLPLLLVSLALAIGGAPDTSLPADAKIEVELELTARPDRKPVPLDATVTILNAGEVTVDVQHPDNRMAVSFLVSDERGNVVAPAAISRIDPSGAVMNLPPGVRRSETFPGLTFITGSAKVGYKLEAGKTYRVVAVYRPEGRGGPGVCSREVVVQIPAAP